MAVVKKNLRKDMETLLINAAGEITSPMAAWGYAQPLLQKHKVARADVKKLLVAWREANEEAYMEALDRDDMDALDKAQYLQELFNGMLMYG